MTSLEYRIIVCVTNFCTTHQVSISNMPDVYMDILANFMNENVCKMEGNISLSRYQGADLRVVIQKNIMEKFEVFNFNEKDLEIALVMAS
jgi:hypothetical protein